MNGAFLDTHEQLLMVSANVDDVTVQRDGDGRVVIYVTEFDDGIEIFHDSDRLWWPV